MEPARNRPEGVITVDDVRRLATALPEVTERTSYGTPAFWFDSTASSSMNSPNCSSRRGMPAPRSACAQPESEHGSIPQALEDATVVVCTAGP